MKRQEKNETNAPAKNGPTVNPNSDVGKFIARIKKQLEEDPGLEIAVVTLGKTEVDKKK